MASVWRRIDGTIVCVKRIRLVMSDGRRVVIEFKKLFFIRIIEVNFRWENVKTLLFPQARTRVSPFLQSTSLPLWKNASESEWVQSVGWSGEPSTRSDEAHVRFNFLTSLWVWGTIPFCVNRFRVRRITQDELPLSLRIVKRLPSLRQNGGWEAQLGGRWVAKPKLCEAMSFRSPGGFLKHPSK